MIRQKGNGHETFEYFSFDTINENQWHHLFFFNYLGSKVTQFCHVGNIVNKKKDARWVKNFQQPRSGTNSTIALQPINPTGELCYFLDLKQETKLEKNWTNVDHYEKTVKTLKE